MIPISDTIERCDVLVVGGGMGGLMAAIAAADGGASVIVVEKADTMRSGSGTTGNDHFVCYIPEVHGTLDAFMKELRQTFAGKNADGNILRKFASGPLRSCRIGTSGASTCRSTGSGPLRATHSPAICAPT